MLRLLLCIYGISFGMDVRLVVGKRVLPRVVQLGGAIVAAVEDDIASKAEAEQAKAQQLNQQQSQRLQDATGHELAVWRRSQSVNGSDEDAHQPATWMDMSAVGRGRYKKKLKLLKYAYPLLIGVLIAKTFLVPLILKMLTALSTSSFVMSKIALVTAGFLALKWIFYSGGGGVGGGYDSLNERTAHIEVVHFPGLKGSFHRGGGGGGGGHWTDLVWSGSNLMDNSVHQRKRHNYIPVSGEYYDESSDPIGSAYNQIYGSHQRQFNDANTSV